MTVCKCTYVDDCAYAEYLIYSERDLPVARRMAEQSLHSSCSNDHCCLHFVTDPNIPASKEDRVPAEIIAGVTCAVVIVLIIVVIFVGYRLVVDDWSFVAFFEKQEVEEEVFVLDPRV